MRITLAKTAGFCFGVDRAVNMAYELASESIPAAALGELIHNNFVTSELESKGVRMIEHPSQANKGETVIIRAHGVGRHIYDELEKAGAEICDATCPFVKKIHTIVSENSSADVPVLIAGDPNHPEVMGIRGHSNGESFVFNSADELEKFLQINPDLCEKGIIAVSQTTFSQK